MESTPAQIRFFRLRAHHLDQKQPIDKLEQAAGACGLQNSPPGAWETALQNRLAGCTTDLLRDALYRRKTLLQAWSFRGTPVVFPTAESDIFLSPLAARDGEAPWIYTRGIAAALDFVGLSFDELLPRVQTAAGWLDAHTVWSKEALDRVLADLVAETLPPAVREKWNAPSMYGSPDKQTVGGAAVSFLLRPCSFASLVVFGERQGASPSFTSFRRWTGRAPETRPDADRALVRKFLHCYGPSTVRAFADWLGCSPKQARRLWDSAADEMEPVCVGGKACFLLSADREALTHADGDGGRLLLLGPHDPYLDLRDRETVLPDKNRQRAVWKTVANPGAVLRGGSVVGTWSAKAQSAGLAVSITVWDGAAAAEQRTLETLAADYAAFRGRALKSCAVGDA